MKRLWTIVGVRDVARSLAWYQRLLGQSETSHAHATSAGCSMRTAPVLLCLHGWGAHEHPTLTSPDRATPGNGLLLFFRVDDFDAALQRAQALFERLEELPHMNPGPGTMCSRSAIRAGTT